MRILILNYEYPPLGGGGGVITRDFAECLAKRIPVTVLTSGGHDLPHDEVIKDLQIIRTPVLLRRKKAVASLASMFSYFPSSLLAGRRLFAAQKYDLVHSFFAIPTGPSGLLLTRMAGVPHVLSLLGGDVYDPSKSLSPHRTIPLKQIVRWVIHRSHRVTAESQDLIDRANEYYQAERVEKIPLAFKSIPFQKINRFDLGLTLAMDDFILVTVGRLISRKRLDQLIAILARIKEDRIKLFIIGDGPLRQDLEAQVRSLGLVNRVFFAGGVSEERKWQLLDVADLFVSTTEHEGFGIVFLEAMESGLPVVTFNCGGHVDFLTEDISRLIPLGDQELFRENILHLYEDKQLMKRMSQRAREEAKKYSIESFTDRYMKLYEDVLRESKSSKFQKCCVHR